MNRNYTLESSNNVSRAFKPSKVPLYDSWNFLPNTVPNSYTAIFACATVSTYSEEMHVGFALTRKWSDDEKLAGDRRWSDDGSDTYHNIPMFLVQILGTSTP